MNTHLRLSMIVAMIIIMSLVGVNLSQAQRIGINGLQNHVTGQANLPWSSQYVQQQFDPPLDVGRYLSIALLPLNDFLAISYYDTTNHSLMIATPIAGHLGNCGTNNNWTCLTVDSNGDVGKYSSIDLWGYSLDNWKMGISYYDSTSRALKAAIYRCFEGSCAWDKITVSAPDLENISIGLYSSFKFNSGGTPAISYFKLNTQYSFSDLMYAYPVPGGGNCGEDDDIGLWTCKEISFLSGEGKYSSLDFSYNDVPYIAYYSVYDGQLKLAFHYPSASMCDEFAWTCLTLDGAGADVGHFASLNAPKSSVDPFRVAYYDKTNGHLKIFDSDWGEPVVVDEMGTSLDPMGITMITDNEGYPVIAYQQIVSDDSSPDLRISRPYMVFGTDPNGNCGDSPPGYLFQYWQCKTLEYGGQYSDQADFAAMAINSKGLLGIAYSEYDSDNYIRSVKFAYQHLIRSFIPITNR